MTEVRHALTHANTTYRDIHVNAHTHVTLVRRKVVRASVKKGTSSHRNSREVGLIYA